MCKPRPGPRCASHARKTLARAVRIEQRIREQFEAGEVDAETLQIATKARALAQLDYDSTPTGQQTLSEHIDRTDDELLRKSLSERLTRAQFHRQSMVQCASLHQSAQSAFETHRTLLDQQQATLLHSQQLLEEADSDLRSKAKSLEDAQTRLEEAREKIRQSYLAQGARDKAYTHALWQYASDIDPSLRTLWLDARKEVKSCTESFNQAQRNHGRARTRYQLSSLNARMTRAEIATGLNRGPDSPIFKNYGQVFINKDGSTNARLLTKIPHTDTEVFARVRTLTDDHAVLETGTKVRLKARIAPSYWRFEAPSSDAVRGPQIFLMEAST